MKLECRSVSCWMAKFWISSIESSGSISVDQLENMGCLTYPTSSGSGTVGTDVSSFLLETATLFTSPCPDTNHSVASPHKRGKHAACSTENMLCLLYLHHAGFLLGLNPEYGGDVTPKRRMAFNGLHGVITTAVRTSHPTENIQPLKGLEKRNKVLVINQQFSYVVKYIRVE
jgi:hypothetical protein